MKKGEDSETTSVSRLKGNSDYNGVLIPLGTIGPSRCLDPLTSPSHFNTTDICQCLEVMWRVGKVGGSVNMISSYTI